MMSSNVCHQTTLCKIASLKWMHKFVLAPVTNTLGGGGFLDKAKEQISRSRLG